MPTRAARVTWTSARELFPSASAKIGHGGVVLDIGCGIRPQSLVRASLHICCEPFTQYVEHLQAKLRTLPRERFLVIQATWQEACDLLPEQSVDVVMLVDVIEHLDKQTGLELLQRTTRIARRAIAVFTPLGFVEQLHPDGKDAWGLDGGAWQEHRSGWEPADFDSNWEIVACREFHRKDNLGREHPLPVGAFWALRVLGPREPMSARFKRRLAFEAREMRRLTGHAAARLLGKWR